MKRFKIEFIDGSEVLFTEVTVLTYAGGALNSSAGIISRWNFAKSRETKKTNLVTYLIRHHDKIKSITFA